MSGFLKNHFRYDTMGSNARVTSYANCLKIPSLGLEKDIESNLLQMIELPEAYEVTNLLIDEFQMAHEYKYQAGFNGRSDGYLVLYRGNYDHKLDRIVQYPGRGIDQGLQCNRFDITSLQRKTKIVQEFDKLCDSIVKNAVDLATNFTVCEEVVNIPTKVKTLKHK